MSRIFTLLFGGLAVLVFVFKTGYLYSVLPWEIASVAIIILILTLCIWVKCKKFKSFVVMILFKLDKISVFRGIVFIVALSVITKLLMTLIFDINSLVHPDINVYITTASELVTKGYAETYAQYCYNFSHMYWFAVVLMPVIALFGINHTAIAIYMIILNTISIVVLYDVVRNIYSNKVAVVIFTIFCLMPSQMLLPNFVTHEQVLTLFIALSVWLLFVVLQRREFVLYKILIFICICINISFAVVINSAGLVLVIAICIIFLLQMINKINMENILLFCAKIVVLVSFVLLIGQVASKIQIEHSRLNPTTIKENKIVWTLYVGSNVETKGTWSIDDANRFGILEDNYTREEVLEKKLELLRIRYMDLIKNPHNILYLVESKLNTIWTIFTYPLGYANELIGNDFTKVVYNSILYKIFLLIEYLIEVTLSICTIGCIHIRRRENVLGFYVFMELYLMGMTVLLLLTECNNKYTISMQCFFVITSLCMVKNDIFYKRKANDKKALGNSIE